jgi:hypothetical protein
VPYPIIKKVEARTYFVNAGEGERGPLPATRTCDDGDEIDWDLLCHELIKELLKIAKKHSGPSGEIDGAPFEAEASPLVHRSLPDHQALADSEFWIWLALVHGQEILARRYSGKINPKNFGVGSASENFFYRLWLRAEVAYDSANEDGYHLARFGDVDFWRSHIFRQGYGDVRSFSRALIQFQFPAEKRRKPRLKIEEIRALAKHLKRARSNLKFELMTEERAHRFIESQWTELSLQSE